MKRNIFFIKWGIALSAFGMFFMTSCYEDKGNYDYTEIQEVTFKEIAPVYSLALGENLTVKPVMNPVPANEADLKYAWLHLNPAPINGNRYVDTIWKEKWIEDVYFPQFLVGQNKLIFQVTDMKRNITYISDYFVVEVANTIKQGFMVLLNDGGEAALKFINYTPPPTGGTGEKAEVFDVYLGDMPPLGAAKGIATYYDSYSPAPDGSVTNAAGVKTTAVNYAITLVTETGLYKLSPLDHTYKDLYHGRHFVLGNYSQAKIVDVINTCDGTRNTAASAYLRDEANNVYYYRQGAASSIQIYAPWTAGVYCNRYAIKDAQSVVTGYTPFEASKAFAGYNQNYYTVLYDKTNRCFAFKASNNNYCDPFTGVGAQFKVNNCDLTFEPLWISMRAHSNRDSRYYLGFTGVTAYAVAKNAGTMDLLVFAASSAASATAAGTTDQQVKINLSGGERNLKDIGAAKFFDIHNLVSVANGEAREYTWMDLLFYATEKNVYAFNMSELNGGQNPVYTPNPSETIVCMKFVPFQYIGNNAFKNNMLVVTTKTGVRSDGTQGPVTIVRVFVPAPLTGVLSLRELEDSEGAKTPCEWTIDGEYAGIDWKGKSL